MRPACLVVGYVDAIHSDAARKNAWRNACADVASARGGSTGPTAFPCEPCIPRRDRQGPREAMKTSLAVTSTRQPDDPLLHVLAEVDVRLVHLEVDPGEDVDQALHLLPVRLRHGLSPLRNGFSVVEPASSALPPMNFEM